MLNTKTDTRSLAYRKDPTMKQIVFARLQAERGKWPKICEATGIGYYWLRRFAQGHIPNPGFNQIQVLYDYFTETGA